ncbi:hypothetical protein B0H13DRAFT_2306562 [Mycena leptocephala]|nr:hypothetical protein B0H13DRAFT_2306562 [Mycena leptocephala]
MTRFPGRASLDLQAGSKMVACFSRWLGSEMVAHDSRWSAKRFTASGAEIFTASGCARWWRASPAGRAALLCERGLYIA